MNETKINCQLKQKLSKGNRNLKLTKISQNFLVFVGSIKIQLKNRTFEKKPKRFVCKIDNTNTNWIEKCFLTKENLIHKITQDNWYLKNIPIGAKFMI